MLGSVFAEFFWVAFQIVIDCIHWLFFDSSEKTPWSRLLLFLFAIVELGVIIVIGIFLQPRLPTWGFVLAISLLVLAAAVGFFAMSDFYRKKMNPV